MGASDRDMQWGTILVFGMNILNLKWSLRKGTRRKDNTYLFYIQTSTLFPNNRSKHKSKSKSFNNNLLEKPSICLTRFISCLFIAFVLSSSSVKFFGLPTVFLHYLAEKNVGETYRDVREREMSMGDKSFLRLRSLV